MFKAKDGRVLKKHGRLFSCESKNARWKVQVHIFALIFKELFPCDGSERGKLKPLQFDT